MPDLIVPREPEPCAWVLPDPMACAPGEDLCGVGADLAPGTLLAAYRSGLFPMNVGGESGPLGWWSPDPRGLLPLGGLRVTRSLRSSMRRFTVTADRDFAGVVRGCADARRPHGWITDDIRAAYADLHDRGWAHSVEVWNAAGELVGGLYGVEVGGLFAGESMFHRERDASKVALVSLVGILASAPGPGRVLDVQWVTDHLASLGAVEIPRPTYLGLLARAMALPPAFPAAGQPSATT